MQAKGLIMMRVLLNRYHQGSPEAFLGGISKEDANQVTALEITSQDVSQALRQPKDVLQKVHYSWLTPAIQQFSKGMQVLIVSALPKSSASSLSKILKLSASSKPPSIPVRLFLINLLCSKLKIEDVMPPAYLPQTSLSALANFKKSQLTELIDFLGLYDLADEIRHIVDKNSLKSIYGCLSIKKQHFLRICLHQKEKLSTTRIGLERWQGDCKQLERILHRRGLVRLGYALSGQHPDLLWHIVHRLDTGRGNVLKKYWAKDEIPGVTNALTQQVLSLMNFFKKMSEA